MTKGNDFIFLYIPKTGSSYTLSIFKEINRKLNKPKYFLKERKLKVKNIYSKRIRYYSITPEKSQHTTVSQISNDTLRKRQLYSIIRNPHYGYISRFEYKHYAKPTWKDDPKYVNLVKSNFPDFPNISFEEYIKLANIISNDKMHNKIGVKSRVTIGALSLQFILMFAFDPKKVLEIIDHDFFTNYKIENYFPEIIFLNNENLTSELYNVLLNHGYPRKFLNFMSNSGRKNVSVKKPYNSYLNNTTKNQIIEIEWFLYEFFFTHKSQWIEAANK